MSSRPDLEPQGLEPEDVSGDGSRRHGYPHCVDCRSADVRPSRSSYPLDKEKIAGGAQSFWRCGNCGDRFVGPLAFERPHRSSRQGNDPLRRAIDAERGRKRWLSPLVVVITTIVVIILVLLMRDSPLGLGVLE